MSKPIDLSNVHPLFHGMIQAIAPEGTKFVKDASAKRVGGSEASPRRLVVESPDVPNYNERD